MSAPARSLPGTARRVARRARTTLGVPERRVPRLERVPRTSHPPTVWMVTPDWDVPSGGVRMQYRVVDLLAEAGVPAAVVHRASRFRCTWFQHDTRIVAAREAGVSAGDVIVLPEIYGPSFAALPRGVAQIVFAQGAYLALDTLLESPHAGRVYADNPDLASVVVVSDDSREVMRYAFPGTPVHRIRHGIDPAIFHPGEAHGRRRIAYMSRRRPDDAALVLRLLALRGALKGWEVVEIRDRRQDEVAEILRESTVFLSFSELEGFGLPPLEALASGCLVVGFHGFGARELFRPPFALAIEDGDVVTFARVVEDLLSRVEQEPETMWAAARAGAAFALERHSPEAERRDVLAVFGGALER